MSMHLTRPPFCGTSGKNRRGRQDNGRDQNNFRHPAGRAGGPSVHHHHIRRQQRHADDDIQVYIHEYRLLQFLHRTAAQDPGIAGPHRQDQEKAADNHSAKNQIPRPMQAAGLRLAVIRHAVAQRDRQQIGQQNIVMLKAAAFFYLPVEVLIDLRKGRAVSAFWR